MLLGDAGAEQYTMFVGAATRTRARRARALHKRVLRGGPDSFEAMRILETEWPDEYGDPSRVDAPKEVTKWQGFEEGHRSVRRH